MHEPKVSLLPRQGLVWQLNAVKCLKVSQNMCICLAKKTLRAFLAFTVLFFLLLNRYSTAAKALATLNYHGITELRSLKFPFQVSCDNWSQSQTHIHHEYDNYLALELIRVELLL